MTISVVICSPVGAVFASDSIAVDDHGDITTVLKIHSYQGIVLNMTGCSWINEDSVWHTVGRKLDACASSDLMSNILRENHDCFQSNGNACTRGNVYLIGRNVPDGYQVFQISDGPNWDAPHTALLYDSRDVDSCSAPVIFTVGVTDVLESILDGYCYHRFDSSLAPQVNELLVQNGDDPISSDEWQDILNPVVLGSSGHITDRRSLLIGAKALVEIVCLGSDLTQGDQMVESRAAIYPVVVIPFPRIVAAEDQTLASLFKYKHRKHSSQVTLVMRDWIARDVYRSGEELPSAGELREIFQVSPEAVSQAMENLVTAGLARLHRINGKYAVADDAKRYVNNLRVIEAPELSEQEAHRVIHTPFVDLNDQPGPSTERGKRAHRSLALSKFGFVDSDGDW